MHSQNMCILETHKRVDGLEDEKKNSIPGYSNSRRRGDLWIHALCSNLPASDTVTETVGYRSDYISRLGEVMFRNLASVK